MNQPDRALGTLYVPANAYVEKDAPKGTIVSVPVDRYLKRQEKRFDRIPISGIPPNIDFSLLTQDQIDATVAATLITARFHIKGIQEVTYSRSDHELGVFDVTQGYNNMTTHGFFLTYLNASGKVEDRNKFDQQLKEIREPEEVGVIERPLVEHLTSRSMQGLDLQVFYHNFAESVQEPVLKKYLNGFAEDQANTVGYLLGRAKSELDKDPKRLEEVDRALLTFEPYGYEFDPNFTEHRKAMIKVSPPGLVRADLVKTAVREKLLAA